MLYIDNISTNPYFNLAAEEYVLKNFDDSFMLWRNEPCIVIGKNQNAMSEINIDYVKKNNIDVVRRLSGGGAVFHDLGNLNYTFTLTNIDKNSSNASSINFRKYTQPIIDILSELGVVAEFSGRNDLTIEGKKISGNAQYYYKNRMLHHGTLLFSSNITDLSMGLNVKEQKFNDKAVKSTKSRVTNISSHLNKVINIIEFKNYIMNFISQKYNINNFYQFNENDINAINDLVKNKYSTYEWNFGKSPKYDFHNELKFPSALIEINMEVAKGIIKNINILGDFFGKNDITQIENSLKGIAHSEEAVKNTLSKFIIDDYILGLNINDLLLLIFPK